ncbi:TlpA family protein disulfide reductase [Candidatus Poribacteria bacterium]|jgi:peroxiredoxin|nr:TlpA family protein disulfide reductase [Candidatus Poribacteria bacterium]MBT5532727.1 TlpA family protein disulfide reductase [Candidatus Poribacteria bacterium]MBT5714313.1 TlpA family protein disulfide reductase [Candidatus Poribacteria bacterium]MBT7097935.1 TlpA family protein disulfide reductase [Candidatus Poribacteria bacterium]MBT7809596.1 TlpA family protein disulfide reductase [Candidatus Poribacteria bacterium]
MRLTRIALLATVSTLLACGAPHENARPPATATKVVALGARQTAPDFELVDLAGAPLRLRDHRGKVVLLNFWATWCPPCVREIPDLMTLREELGADRVEVLGISLDTLGVDVVRKFAQERGIAYPTAVDTQGVSAKYGGVSSIPTTFVIDADGGLVEKIVGMRSKKQFLAAVERASKG